MSNLKQWPNDGAPVKFSDIIDPLRKVLRRGEYTGLDIGESLKAGCLSPDEALDPDTMEENGRDRATVILTIAIQLGIEQGQRMKTGEIVRAVESMIKDRRLGEDLDLDGLLAAIRGSCER
jgi:hypothetical protein